MMGKVVIDVDGGFVRRVLTDNESLQILVLDRDTAGVGKAGRLVDVLGLPAAVDSAVAVEIKFSPGMVERAYRETGECLTVPGVEGSEVNRLREMLGTRSLRRFFDPDTCDRIARLFRDAGFAQVKVLAGGGNHPRYCEIYLAPTGEPQRCVASLEFDGQSCTALVFNPDFDGSLTGGNYRSVELPANCSSFTAASCVLDFFDNHASGNYKI